MSIRSALLAAAILFVSPQSEAIGQLEAVLTSGPAVNGGRLWVNDTGLSVNVVAPADFAVALRAGTLREISLELGPGPLRDELARAHRARRTIPSATLKLNDGSGGQIEVQLQSIRVSSYDTDAANSRPPLCKFAWGAMTMPGRSGR